jgi:PAS domain S-box-containing protein
MPDDLKLAPNAAAFLTGGGEMGELIRGFDWAATSLGSPDRWPQSLRSAVSILLPSRAQICLFWGPELITIYNDAYRPALGMKHPRALGRPGREVWSEFWEDVLRPLLEGVLNTGEALWASDYPFFLERHGYPEETYFDISYDPVRDESGGVGGVFCIVSETTGRVVGERRLRILRDIGRLASEVRDTEDAFRRVAEVIGANPRDLPFALFFDRGGDESAARCVAACGIDPFAPSVLPLATLTAERREGFVSAEELRARISLPGGEWPEPARMVGVLPIAAAGQDAVGFMVAGLSPRRPPDEGYRDFLRLIASNVAGVIGAARALQEEHKRVEALAEIDRTKTAFFSNVSHEFRTPLTLMLGPLEEMIAGPAEALPQRREDLALVHRSGLRLLRLVNTLLDFSRIEAGRMQASYEPVDLAICTAELASVFRAATEKAGLRLAVDCPPLSESIWVDRDMWEKIVLNLVSNAFKYTLEGGITVRLREENEMAVLTVADTGTGIPPDELPRIFDRFHRVAGAHGRTHEGTGIGLALVQELVRLHGGTVCAESVLGKGSTFIVAIPFGSPHLPSDRLRAERTLASTALGAQPYVEEALRWLPGEDIGSGGTRSASEPDVAYELLPERTTTAAVGGERATVLLADDNADMRAYVCRLLAPLYEVQTAADGIAALATMRERRPDLLLSDVMMPRLDGVALVREVRADPALASIPVVLLSARAGEGASIEGLQAGADDYLTKPFSAREMLARVAANLKTAKLRAQLQAIVDHAPIGMYFLDSELRIRHVNPKARPVFGDIPNLIGRDFSEVMHILWPTATAKNVMEWFQHTLTTGEPHRVPEFSAERRDLNRREYYDWQIHRIALPDGQHGVVCYFEDISAHVLAREALRASEERLQHLNETLERRVRDEIAARERAQNALFQAQKLEAIGQLTGGIAHDFNNLLTAIIGNLDVLSAGRLSEKARRHIDSAIRAAQRGATLTQQLLAYARKQYIAPRPVDVNQLVLGLDDLLRRSLGGLINVETRLADDLWRASSDPTQLELAILNLAINARDAMPLGGSLSIETRNTPAGDDSLPADLEPGDYIQLSIRDTGEGMTPEILAKALDPFFTTKEIGKGSGLGLSQVYGVVKQCGGAIKLESTPSAGTTVLIWLRRTMSVSVEAEQQNSRAQLLGRRGCVLVVDDDPDVRELAVETLRSAGYRIEEAASGVGALDILDKGIPVDVAIVDYAMPCMSGAQFVHEASKRRPDLPVVYITGYADPEGIGRNADAMIVKKPYRAPELLRAVESALKKQSGCNGWTKSAPAQTLTARAQRRKA